MPIARRTILLGLAAKAWAQDQQPTFSADVNVVSFLATVRDKDGRVAQNLTADDFTLLEDGVPQKIRYFSRETDLPLTIGLLVDTSRSQTGVLEQERRASQTFLDRVLRPDKDHAFIASFDERVAILQDLTSSRTELSAALDRLAIPGHYATLIFRAIKECAERVMRKQSGRKAFILLTDGVAYHDDTSIGTAIEFAQRADTIVFSIRFSDAIRAYRPVRALVESAAKEKGKGALARMARETGGTSFEVSKGTTVESAYAQIEEALRNQYSIGYTPDPPSEASKYHKILLKPKNKALTVAARDGYYAK
jgi:VWFA-related protein